MATSEPGEADASRASVAGSAPRPKSPRNAFLGRMLVVHLVAYPVAFVAAVAEMPIAIWYRKTELLEARPTGASVGVVRDAARGLSLTPTEAAQLQLVLVFILWSSVLMLLLVHLAGLPWAVGAARAARDPELSGRAAKGFRIFGLSCATIGGVVLVLGVAGWIWLFTL